MEATAIPASVGLTRTRLAIGAPLLRLRSDEQLVSLFRAGSDEAFRAIHDRYRQRLFAYTRQMLGGSAADAEDVVQEIFVRAYGGLRASDRRLALRAWLYRIAHNRCIDELRRPHAVATDTMEATATGAAHDPVARVEQRDALRRLIADVQRLPEQQRSALLMRELGGVAYADIAGALSVSVPAVKSLLVRARVGLVQASEARDTACAEIRENLILSHDRGVRTSGLARRHMRDCSACRQFRGEVRGMSRQLAGLGPTLGPAGVVAKLLGLGGGGGAAAGSVSGGSAGAAAAGGAAGTGAAATAGAFAGAGHVVTLLAAAVVTAGGAIELQQQVSHPLTRGPAHHRTAHVTRSASAHRASTGLLGQSISASAPSPPSAPTAPPVTGATPLTPAPPTTTPTPSHQVGSVPSRSQRISHAPLLPSQAADPDNFSYVPSSSSSSTATGDAAGSSTADGSSATTQGSTTSGSPTTTGNDASTGTAGAASSGGNGNTQSSGTTATPGTSSGQPASTTGTSSSSSSSGGASPGASTEPKHGSQVAAVFTVTSR